MIKRYSQFVHESYSQEEHHSIGEYVGGLAEKDEFIKMIVGQYTKDVDASINMANAINVLDDLTKVEILKRVENHLNGVEGEVSVGTSTPVDLLEESYGFNVLTTFFKCLTALGFKDNTPESKEVPSEFLIFFKLGGVDSSKIESVFKRFKSLSSIKIDYTHPKMGLYFGIRNSGSFEYGVYYDDLLPIGTFKLNKKSFNSLKLSELKSSSGLKKMLVNLSLADIILMGKIKSEMDKFNPGYFQQKMIPIINDRVMTFGYHGVGKWDNGQLDQVEKEKVVSSLKSFLSKYKWSEKVQIRVYADKFWIYIDVKLKQ